jgi:hypothetical protein
MKVNLEIENEGKLVPSYVEEHLSELLLAVLHKDNSLYKTNASSVI